MGAIEQRRKIISWFERHKGKFDYANTYNNTFNPAIHKAADCADVVDAAYREVGIDLPGMSYEQAAVGRQVARGNTAAQFASIQSELRPGDIVAMAMRDGIGGGTRINHVEVYDTDGYSWGHGGVPRYGPNRHAIAAFLKGAAWWTVRRLIENDNNEVPVPVPAPEIALLERIIKNMNFTHVIFGHKGNLYLANLLAGTYRYIPSPELLETIKYVLRTAGAKLVYWDQVNGGGGLNVESIEAFGKEV